ncbi:MAG: transglutaminase-like domain-containing protein [Candidatus Falkowbacteria bacterium]
MVRKTKTNTEDTGAPPKSDADAKQDKWQKAYDKQQADIDAKLKAVRDALAAEQAVNNQRFNQVNQRQTSFQEASREAAAQATRAAAAATAAAAANQQANESFQTELRNAKANVLQENKALLIIVVVILVILGATATYFTVIRPLQKTYLQRTESFEEPMETIRPNSLNNSSPNDSPEVKSPDNTPSPDNNPNQPIQDTAKPIQNPYSPPPIQNKDTAQAKPAPVSPNAKKASYSWKYNGQTETVKLSFDPALKTAYAQRAPDYKGNKDSYYEKFLNKLPGDQAVDDLVGQLKAIASRRKLSDDQTAELAIKFVQNALSYDHNRAANLNAPGSKINHPFETLERGQGVCSDKALLLVDVLRKLGYGAAFIDLPNANHAAVGLAVAPGSDVYNSGYCFVETTNDFAVGEVPSSLNGGQAQTASLTNSRINAQSIGPATIILKRSGKTYTHLNLPAQMARH